MASALPIVSDCRASCDCTSTVNVTDAVAAAVAAAGRFVFETIPDLRAFATPVDNAVAHVLGDVTRGDGGDGLYYYNASSMAVDDGMGVLKPNNVAVLSAGRWIKLM